jgi:hypothetical protein
MPNAIGDEREKKNLTLIKWLHLKIKSDYFKPTHIA